MNLDLQATLQECGVTSSDFAKSEKVKILARWNKEFPRLVQAARHGQQTTGVAYDNVADEQYGKLRNEEFFVLPDDESGMPSYLCRAEKLPDLRELVSDTVTKCDELVILAADFSWSAVLVNHGSPQLVARYFQNYRKTPRADSSSL